MKRLLLAATLLWPVLPAFCDQNQDENVNSRYTVESVELDPVSKTARLSNALQEELHNLVGTKVNNETLNTLGKRIAEELKIKSVSAKMQRGDAPEHVKVVFDTRTRSVSLNTRVTKFLFHSKQGWTAEGETAIEVAGNEFAFGLVSDGDELLERYSGIRAAYRRANLGSKRVRFVFDYENFHNQWSPLTENPIAAQRDVPGTYRSRTNIQPTLTLTLLAPLTLSVGASLQSYEMQYPAARTEAANSVVNSLRYSRNWEGSDHNRKTLVAGYELHAATNLFGSDYVYARHNWYASYNVEHGRQQMVLSFMAGRLTGRAPLNERFVLGNSRALRGWNKHDLDPLGGDSVVSGSADYRYRILRVFYDTGAIWDNGQTAGQKHSAGVGLKKGGFLLAVAFPLREGRADPVFYAGLTF